MLKVLLDTDIGGDIDDAICLAYLLKEPQCDLIGITTVSGQSEIRAEIADAICKVAGKTIPIVAGMDTTLQPIPIYPTPDGANALKNWEYSDFAKGDAPKFLYEKIKSFPHEITLIGIGNMTNIAAMFQRYPDAPRLLKGLYVMNGYFGKKPLPDAHYNWNSWADPLASKIVFNTPVDIHRVMPLEVTRQLTSKAEKAKDLLYMNTNLVKCIFDFGHAWLESSHTLTLHDPLAAISVFYPDICGYRRGTVQVEVKKQAKLGTTKFTSDKNGIIEIATSVNKNRFYEILSHTLGSS